MNTEEFKKRENEVAKYIDTIFDKEAAKKSNYAILGGEEHPVIEEAIKRVFEKLKEKSKESKSTKKIFDPKENISESSPPEYSITYVVLTETLIDLLKDDRYLIEKLGDTKTNKLYNEFYTFDEASQCWFLNPLCTLTLCLMCVKEQLQETKNKDISYKNKKIPKNAIPLMKEIGRTLSGRPIPQKKRTYGNKFLNAKSENGQTYGMVLRKTTDEFTKLPFDSLTLYLKIIALGCSWWNKTENISIPAGRIKKEISQRELCEHFLTKKKTEKINRYLDYDIKKMLKELFDKQDFIIRFAKNTGCSWILKTFKLYDFEIQKTLQSNKLKYYLTIDLTIIDPLFKDYIYLDKNETEKTEKFWKEYWDKEYPRYSKKKIIKEIINNGIIKAAPAKLILLLKTIYNGHPYAIKVQELNENFGDIDSIIVKTLIKTKYIDKNVECPQNSKTFKRVRGDIYDCIFYTTKKLGLINDFPKKPEQGQWRIYPRKFYFEGSLKTRKNKMLKTRGENA
ncbi:MAG: hypothetical protein Nk1A_6580 [Endomicrobiia bacterium]|nr:MAG: hypothetical protein Nk1A_6580 [Endomicrobiia bacterium]